MYGGNEKSLEEVIAEVKQSVIGQDAAIEWLATFVDAACSRAQLIVERGLNPLDLPSVGSGLIVGPTASGKSHMMKTFARVSGLLFRSIDAGSMTAEGYKGNSFSNEWWQLSAALEANPGSVALVFVDEVDKMVSRGRAERGGDATFDLLKPLEGGKLRGCADSRQGEGDFELDCDRCVFVFAGAFTGVEDLVRKRLGASKNVVGFVAGDECNRNWDDAALRAELSLEDIEAWGFPRELVGRFSTVHFMSALSAEALTSVVKRGKQVEYARMLEEEGVAFAIDDAACKALVEYALRENYGARALGQRLNALFFGPVWRAQRNDASISKIVITVHDGELDYKAEHGPRRISQGAMRESSGDRAQAKMAYGLLKMTRAHAMRLMRDEYSESAKGPLPSEAALWAAQLLVAKDEVSLCGADVRVANDYSLAEITLVAALHALLRDWFPAKDFTREGATVLLRLAKLDGLAGSALDLMFRQIETGTKYAVNPFYGASEQAELAAVRDSGYGDLYPKMYDRKSAWTWQPSKFSRNTDGTCPAATRGMRPGEDAALGAYIEFTGYSEESKRAAIESLAWRLL